MTFLELLENRLAIDHQKPDYWDRKKHLDQLGILLGRLRRILHQLCERNGPEHLETLGCEIKIDPSPGFQDFGERKRRESPGCPIEHLTFYFTANNRNIQTFVPLEIAERLLFFSFP